MRDVLGTIYEDEDFAELFEVRGRPAIAPWRSALVTLMQFAEGLSPIGRRQKPSVPA
jgi:transposase